MCRRCALYVSQGRRPSPCWYLLSPPDWWKEIWDCCSHVHHPSWCWPDAHQPLWGWMIHLHANKAHLWWSLTVALRMWVSLRRSNAKTCLLRLIKACHFISTNCSCVYINRWLTEMSVRLCFQQTGYITSCGWHDAGGELAYIFFSDVQGKVNCTAQFFQWPSHISICIGI